MLDSEELTPQTRIDAYTAIFQMVSSFGDTMFSDGFPACYASCYNFVRDSLSEHIHSKVNEAEARDVPKLAPTAGALTLIDGICGYLHRHYLAKRDLEQVAAFAVHTFREAALEKLQSDSHLLSDWLQVAIEGVRQGTEPSDEANFYGRRLLEIYELHRDYYATHFSVPFIRDAVPLYHEKAKALVSHDAFEAQTQEILDMETRRAEVFLHEPYRSDYVKTVTELFDLGDEKFQRS